MTNSQHLYVATTAKRDKIINVACSVAIGAAVVAGWSTGERLFTVGAILLITALLCETFVKKLVFTDTELVYTNILGKKKILPYSEIVSLRYVLGSELTITALDGSRIKLTYGDFVRMIDIIGEKTNREPPLEIAELSWRFSRRKR
jgi:hypothetical protein